ncbi:MAG: ABC transporter permease [Anaerofustis stercorihominis]|nr:ABC transporter permease [Anaerofustis stercorihominis]
MKILRLTGNELRKLFAKKSTIFVIILALLVAVGIPFADSYSSNMYGDDRYYVEYLEREIEFYTENIERVEEDLKATGESYYYYDLVWNKAYLASMQLKLDSGVASWEDWREEFSHEGYIPLLQEKEAIQPYIKNNKTLIKKYEESGLSGMIDSVAMNYYYEKESTKKLKARLNEINSLIGEIETAYKENDVDFVNQYYYDKQQAVIDGINDNIDSLNKQRKELIKYNYKGMNDEAIKNIKEQIAELKDKIPFEEELLRWKQYRIDHRITPGYSAWQSRAMNQIDSAVHTLNMEPMTKDEYDAGGGEWNDTYTEKQTYDEYILKFEETQNEARDNITLYTYAIENDIAPLEYTNSTRAKLNDYLYFSVYAAAFVAIILGCAIVSREYSKGTIRLLLIRPVRRYKVLLSKILAVLLITALIFVAYSLITSVATVYFFGQEDYNQPIIYVSDGEIASYHLMDRAVGTLYVSAIAVVFVMAMSIMFSTVFKSTILAVGVPMLMMLASPLAAELLNQFNYYDILKNTPFAYMNLYSIINNTSPYSWWDVTLDPKFGFMMLAGLSVVMFVITFLVFCRRDVKN